MSTRIYVVEIEATEQTKLIDASSHWQAIKHAVKGMVRSKIASAKEVAELVGGGVKVESVAPSDINTTAINTVGGPDYV